MMNGVIILGVIAIILGVILLYGSRYFYIKKDERYISILEALPGVNCGACGFAGCAGLAGSIVKGDNTFSKCSVIDDDSREEASKNLGIKIEAVQKSRSAVLLCNGGSNCKDSYDYQGALDCSKISDLAGGSKACTYGCVGAGNCARACPFDVITMGDDGLPHIDEHRCVSCEKCVVACPRDLIEIQDITKGVVVVCSSYDKGGDTKKNCSAGCIGCKICEKKCEFDAIIVENFLSKIDRDKCTQCMKCVEACPSKVIFLETNR